MSLNSLTLMSTVRQPQIVFVLEHKSFYRFFKGSQSPSGWSGVLWYGHQPQACKVHLIKKLPVIEKITHLHFFKKKMLNICQQLRLFPDFVLNSDIKDELLNL